MKNSKRYEKYNLVESSEIFNEYYGNLIVPIHLRVKLAKDLGFSYDLYNKLASISPEAATQMVATMSSSKQETITLLIDDANHIVLGYSLDTERTPILNADFIKRVKSLVDSCDAITCSEVYCMPDESTASVIIKKKDPIVVEEKFENKASNFINYSIGVLLMNDEMSSAYSRLVLYVGDQPLYLPASYYNTTTSRYKRSTATSEEALEVLVLKIIDDLRDDAMQYKLVDFHYRYRANKKIAASYEEYNSVLRTMRKIPSIIEDNSCLEGLLSKYENFERKYTLLEDKKSSYLWRCTALGDTTVGDLVSLTADILTELGAPAMEYYPIRDLLGSYISTSRIAEEIAE